MYEIPTSIELDGRQFSIRNNGDFRVILDCFQALGDIELDARERLLAALIIFYEDLNTIEDVEALPDLEKATEEMYKFFNCGKINVTAPSPGKLVDWELDSQLISSAVNKVCGFEIRSAPYIHWWTFMGYYTAIGECPFSTIIGIRNKMLRGKKLEKYEQQYKRENPQYFTWNSQTVEKSEADKLVKELWNSEG